MICKKHRAKDSDGKDMGDHIWFWCPGCKSAHSLRVNAVAPYTGWDWNGSLESPTFSPSLLVTVKFGEEGKLDHVCHSFIKEGKMQFLGDCTHDLKNKTVPLPELPDWLAEE